MFILGNYKIIGLNYMLQDHLLTLAGAVGHAFGVAARIGFPTLLDYYSFKSVGSILMISLLILLGTTPFVLTNGILYFI